MQLSSDQNIRTLSTLRTLREMRNCRSFSTSFVTFSCFIAHKTCTKKVSSLTKDLLLWRVKSKLFPVRVDSFLEGKQKQCWQLPSLNVHPLNYLIFDGHYTCLREMIPIPANTSHIVV